MTYRIPLPVGGRQSQLDLVRSSSTGIQRQLRRDGLASYEPSTAAALLTLFEQHGDDLSFADVGANIGVYSCLAAAMFRPCAVRAFEPSPTTAAVADAIVRANRLPVHVERVALSDEEGHARLHLSPIADTSNSLDAGFRGGDESIDVVLTTLDRYVADSGWVPNVMKIDVETHEAAVLRGAAETLRRHRPSVVVEILTGRRGRDFAAEISDAFDGLGYLRYELTESPTFVAADRLRSSDGPTRDWLLSPEPLADDFAARHAHWAGLIAACTPDRNPRPGVGEAVAGAMRRGGLREVIATAGRAARRSNRST